MDAHDGPRGLGGLLTTEVDRIALGTHHGHDLHARVERRSLRLSAGRQWHLSMGLGRTRPVAIEVATPGEWCDLRVVAIDPWWRLVRRIGAVLTVAMIATFIAGRIRAQKARHVR